MAYTRSIRSTVSGIQRNLFGTGMEDHHNVADLFQMVRTHGKWGCEIWYHLSTTLCRWVLHVFVYSDFHQQWFPWWEVTTVLPAIGVLETLAQHDEASWKFSSPLVWWCLRLDHLLITMRQMRRFHSHWFGDIRVSERFHGNPSWNSRYRSLGTMFFFVEDERRLASSLSSTVRQRSLRSLLFGNFAMRIVKIFTFGWWQSHRFRCWKNRWDEFGISAMPWDEKFRFCTEVYLSMSFIFVLETNRKQTACTNQFSMWFWNNSSF